MVQGYSPIRVAIDRGFGCGERADHVLLSVPLRRSHWASEDNERETRFVSG